MTKNGKTLNSVLKASVLMVFFAALAGLVVFYTGVLQGGMSTDGLSGLVSVKGTVTAEALNLTEGEVKRINRTVASYADTFTQFNLHLEKSREPGPINAKSRLVMAMVLETDSECEVRSWSKKLYRSDLVPQMVSYIKKAAVEYQKFRKYPDVKQNFKCLYI